MPSTASFPVHGSRLGMSPSHGRDEPSLKVRRVSVLGFHHECRVTPDTEYLIDPRVDCGPNLVDDGTDGDVSPVLRARWVSHALTRPLRNGYTRGSTRDRSSGLVSTGTSPRPSRSLCSGGSHPLGRVRRRVSQSLAGSFPAWFSTASFSTHGSRSVHVFSRPNSAARVGRGD